MKLDRSSHPPITPTTLCAQCAQACHGQAVGLHILIGDFRPLTVLPKVLSAYQAIRPFGAPSKRATAPVKMSATRQAVTPDVPEDRSFFYACALCTRLTRAVS